MHVCFILQKIFQWYLAPKNDIYSVYRRLMCFWWC